MSWFTLPASSVLKEEGKLFKNKRKLRDFCFYFLFLVPGLVIYIGLYLGPAMASIPMAFFKWNMSGAQRATFIGVDNFARLIKEWDVIWKLIKNNLFLVLVNHGIAIVVALIICAMVNSNRMRKAKDVQFYRGVMYFPNILPTMVLAIMYGFLFSPVFGMITPILKFFGLDTIAAMGVLANKASVKPALILIEIWNNIGFYFVIYLAASSGISRDYYEAAAIDGASEIRQFFSITLPLLKGAIKTTILLALAGLFSYGFVLIKALTGGGPSKASEILSSYMYLQAFQGQNIGYACAIATVIFVLSMGIYTVSNKFLASEDDYA